MRIPDFLKPGRGFGRFSPMGLFLIVGILGVYAANEAGIINIEDVSIYGNRTDLVLKVSGEPLPQSGDIIPLDVQVQLINNTDALIELTAPTPCKVFKWVLLDSRRDFVQAKAEEICPQVLMQATLEGNHNTIEGFVLEIDATRLRPDSSYELHVNYWGVMATLPVDFVL